MTNPIVFTPIWDEKLKAALDLFAGCFDLRITVFDTLGRRLATGGTKPHCRFCRAQQRRAGGRLCRESDEILFRESRETGRRASRVCHGGLVEAVHPIVAWGHLYAFIMVGQIWPKSGARGRHGNARRVALFSEKESYTPERIARILELFDLLVDHLIRDRLIRFRTDEKFHTILTYLEKNYARPVTMAELGALVGLGRSSVTSLFSRYTGMSFKKILTGLRLEAFEKTMREHPGLSVQEAALRAGYVDSLFFSRVYRSVRGCRPSVFRRRILSIEG